MSSWKIINASCIDQNVDAIVNASNKYLVAGGGVCGAIFQKAGFKELREACEKIETPLKDGDAVITPSFQITNAKAIIHAVGPNFGITPKAYPELKKAYYNSLVVLKENNYHSIAFPLISAGIYGFGESHPAEVSAKEFIKAYQEFVEEYPDYEINALLCAFSKQEMKEIENIKEV